jgi:translation initiation factor IF-2
MADDTTDNDRKAPLTLRTGTLELKKTVEKGRVRQSFSHGRSKEVKVEVRRKRTISTGGSPASEHSFDNGVLTNSEKAQRLRVLQEARRVEEENRRAAEEAAIQAAEEAAARAVEEEARRKVEKEEGRRRAEEEAARAAEEDAAKRVEDIAQAVADLPRPAKESIRSSPPRSGSRSRRTRPLPPSTRTRKTAPAQGRGASGGSRSGKVPAAKKGDRAAAPAS